MALLRPLVTDATVAKLRAPFVQPQDIAHLREARRLALRRPDQPIRVDPQGDRSIAE
jgi:hypothetical protein